MQPAAAPDPLLVNDLAKLRDRDLQRLEASLRRRCCAIRRREDLTFQDRQTAMEPYLFRRQLVLNAMRARNLKPVRTS